MIEDEDGYGARNYENWAYTSWEWPIRIHLDAVFDGQNHGIDDVC